MDNTIGKNIKLLREKIGLTQDEIANYLDLSRIQIIRYEQGTSSVPTKNLAKLATLFSIDEYDFYEDDLSALTANLVFAFRANELNVEDLKTIAAFKKIAMNYLKMKQHL
jgi:transcriptional regulator with XRE-family HTH domain